MNKGTVMADKPDDDDPVFDVVFETWARKKLDKAAKANPGIEPLTYEDFDGCSAVPDVCLPCCLMHDIAYHYGHGRTVADAALRDCIIASGAKDREWWSRWFYVGLGWSWWLAVRIFGGRAWKGPPK